MGSEGKEPVLQNYFLQAILLRREGYMSADRIDSENRGPEEVPGSKYGPNF